MTVKLFKFNIIHCTIAKNVQSIVQALSKHFFPMFTSFINPEFGVFICLPSGLFTPEGF